MLTGFAEDSAAFCNVEQTFRISYYDGETLVCFVQELFAAVQSVIEEAVGVTAMIMRIAERPAESIKIGTLVENCLPYPNPLF